MWEKAHCSTPFLGKSWRRPHKPQTTQRRFQGVLTEGNQQIVFVDTPGLHEAKKGLHVFMVDEALSALKDVDLVVFVVEVAPPKNPRGRSPTQS